MALEFLILSTGRSGSGWISSYLSNRGIPTGHEKSFSLQGFTDIPALKGESSWLALLEGNQKHFPKEVFLQVRNPLDVISSYVAHGDWNSPYGTAKLSLLPRQKYDSRIEYGLDIWVHLNSRALQFAESIWQVENVQQSVEFANFFNKKGLLRNVATQDQTNGHNSLGRLVSWGDLETFPSYPKLLDLCDLFGYDLPL